MPDEKPTNFIHEIIEEDLRSGRYDAVYTRFPPEPNGYLHIGHAKSIVLNFSIAQKYGGKCNLRFDDTNPTKEEDEYVQSIMEDVRWLGYEWDELRFASDYFEQLYQWAVQLIKDGKAYVDDLSPEEIRQYRGTLTEPGKNSPYRDRSVEENLQLFEKMKNGEFPNGSKVLRAKIDMASPNMNLRDPVLYRVLHASHHRTGDTWCIYPMYDFAHGQSDAIEGITHSICTLEFENHRPLYEWFLDNLPVPHKPRQIEFARLNLSYTVLSKRKLIRLVKEGFVRGWDDPRMPTLAGLRRRGVPPEALRNFCEAIGVAKNDSVIDVALLDYHIRQVLNKRAERRMAVLNPVKVIIDNYPPDQVEWLEAINNPEDESAGTRQVPFSRELYIERDDFREVRPNKKYHRLSIGHEVRLRYGYFIKAERVVKNAEGEITEIHCTYDPETRGGYAPDGRKVRGTIHWVSAAHALDAEVRLYDRLFNVPDPAGDAEKDFTEFLNPGSLQVLTGCKLEPDLGAAEKGTYYQFERKGYFILDADSTKDHLVFNRTISLRDTWSKLEKKLK